MALAAMCSKYLPDGANQLEALVVDHSIRPGSREEAQDIRRILITHCGKIFQNLAVQRSLLTFSRRAGRSPALSVLDWEASLREVRRGNCSP